MRHDTHAKTVAMIEMLGYSKVILLHKKYRFSLFHYRVKTVSKPAKLGVECATQFLCQCFQGNWKFNATS